MSNFGAIDEKPRRFYKTAEVAECDGGFSVELDGRPIKTPLKRTLAAPRRAVAELIAMEWSNQGDRLEIADMHITRLANVAADRTPQARDEMIEEAARYAETDLICHLAEEPDELVTRQEAAWAPLREWAGEALGVVLVPSRGVMSVGQPSASLDAVRLRAGSLDDWRLTGLNYGLGLLGSAVIALALEQGRIDADEAFSASRVDETFQTERWGIDEEAQHAAVRRHVEILALEAYFLALRA